jgi:type IX secretion system PorP/SprF family membrane protein
VKIYIPIILFFCFIQFTYSQEENGIVAFDIPVRNSLTFNRYLQHPAFSFVREQNKYITLTNKRELVQVEDAPQTYLFNYSGRFRENIGAGIGLFQQNYGVLTTFGGVVNFAYNARLEEDSNLTLGINIGAYQSSLNNGKVVTNFPDPALDNVPSNFLLSVHPGINYGTGFMDFGVSFKNAVVYNFETSGLLEDNPKQGIQGHIMYTGYLGGYGFFGDSRFTALANSEFQKETSIFSGVFMITVPKGVWAQVGYNSLYGASGGLGINITPQIAVEYNYEKPFMGLSDLGSAHEITIAYRFKNDNYYDYSRDDELAGLFTKEKKRTFNTKKTATKKPESPTVIAKVEPETTTVDKEAESKLKAEEEARIAAEEKARIATEEQARLATEEQARIAAEEQARIAAEEQARLASEEQARIAAEEQARKAADEKARIAAEEQARIAAEEQARLASEEQARLAAEKNANENLIKNPKDEIGINIIALAEETDASSLAQTQLLEKLETAVANKEKDLKDLKEENDLSEQNIYVAPKPFKSISEENKAIETIKINLDTIIIRQQKKITQLESLLAERIKTVNNPNDATNLYYQKELATLKVEQDKAIRTRASLMSSLEQIAIATDFERKRRIKRAGYDNDQDRYVKDRNTLNILKQSVSVLETEPTKNDFDYGEKRNNNIQIIKNVKNTESAYYLVLAVHSSVSKRDDFITQVLASGYRDVDFFFDVNTSEYYIYSKKFYSIEEANAAIKAKEDKAYNENISIIKIEN